MQTLKLTKKYEIYPEYKNSEVDWFGKIPKNWDVLKGKFVFQNKKEINHGMKNDNVLSLTMNGVINRDSSNNEGLLPSDYQSFQIFEKNDLVFKLIDLENYKTSRVGIVHEKGIMSPVYIRLETKKDYLPKYFYYLYYRLYLEGIYNFLGSGVRSSLSPTDLMKLEVVIPDLNEQKLVVDLLDKKTKEIDQIIEKKQRLIELLREKRTAVINHAVTKGLDSKAELAESGIDWIGRIPKNWEVKKLKFIGEAIIGLTYSPENITDESGTLVLRSSNVQKGLIELGDNVYVSSPIPKKLITRKGDILICSRNGSRSLIGKNAYIDEKSEGLSFGAFMTVFRTKNWRFVSYFLNSNLFMSQLSSTLTSTINQLTTHYLNNVLIAIPPEKEQIEIVNYLEKKLENYDKAINFVEKSVEILQEFKSSLISNVVTGKVKI